MKSFDQLRESLLEEDGEFRELATLHEELDNRIKELSRQVYRSNTEKVEESILKKRKLRLKDQMEPMLRRQASSEGPAAPALQPPG